VSKTREVAELLVLLLIKMMMMRAIRASSHQSANMMSATRRLKMRRVVATRLVQDIAFQQEDRILETDS
jgi:hypothetical protein